MGSMKNIHVIYRGIDTKKFSYCFNENDSRLRILFIGGIPFYKHLEAGRNLKGGISLMNAWKNVEEKLFSLNCELIFAGPDANSETALEWHHSLKHKSNVVLRGMLTPEDVMKEYRQAHVVVIPSLEEGMPNVALEAGATGKCLIASNVGGIPELITNKLNGVIIEPGDEVDLENALIFCAKDRIHVRKMGFKIRNVIESKFESKGFAEKYFEMYKKVLSN